MTEPDFAHTDGADSKRREKAVALARYIWELGISRTELAELADGTLRKLARAADVNPPSTRETWDLTGDLLDRKDEWARANPDHPAAVPSRRDEKITWVKPPIAPWR